MPLLWIECAGCVKIDCNKTDDHHVSERPSSPGATRENGRTHLGNFPHTRQQVKSLIELTAQELATAVLDFKRNLSQSSRTV